MHQINPNHFHLSNNHRKRKIRSSYYYEKLSRFHTIKKGNFNGILIVMGNGFVKTNQTKVSLSSSSTCHVPGFNILVNVSATNPMSRLVHNSIEKLICSHGYNGMLKQEKMTVSHSTFALTTFSQSICLKLQFFHPSVNFQKAYR